MRGEPKLSSVVSALFSVSAPEPAPGPAGRPPVDLLENEELAAQILDSF